MGQASVPERRSIGRFSRAQSVALGLLGLLGVLVAPRAAWANGYDYPDLGTVALGRGGAFVARADDPTALYYNPAGAARLSGTQLLVGGNLFITRTTFQRLVYDQNGVASDRYPHAPSIKMPKVVTREAPFFTPLLMVTSDFGGILRRFNLVALAGIYGPNSHRYVEVPRYCKRGVDPCEAAGSDGLPSPARYDTLSRAVIVLFPSFGLAWSPLPWVSVGAVFQLGYANLQYRTAAGTVIGQDPDFDIDISLDISSGVEPIGLFGVHLRPFRWLEVGASARIGFTFEAKGDVNANVSPQVEKRLGFPFEVSPTPAAASMQIPLPWVVRAGLRYVHHDTRNRELFDVEFDFVWENLSVLETFDVKTSIDVLNANTGQPFIPTIKGIPVVHGWKDAVSLRLGGSYTLYDALPARAEMIFRAGLVWESSPMPDALTRLDFLSLERYGMTLGLGARWGRYRLDLAYALYVHRSRDVGPEAGKAPCGDFGSTAGCGSQVKEIVPVKATRFGEPVGNGRYEATIHLVSVSVRVTFGER